MTQRKWATAAAVAATMLATMAAGPASASAVYAAVGQTGKLGAYIMSGPFSVAQRFVLSSSDPFDAIAFAMWTANGAGVAKVQWEILDDAPRAGGAVVASGVAKTISLIPLVGPGIGDGVIGPPVPSSRTDGVAVATFSVRETTLTPGDYWLSLHAVETPVGDFPPPFVAWDIAALGPPTGEQFVDGQFFQQTPVLTFALLHDDITAPPPVPEPSAWALAILGFGLAGAGLRRARRGDVGAGATLD